MVTAILITGVFIYFFITTMKERKKNIQQWESVGIVNEVAVITGKVSRSFQEKKRFYQSHWIWHTEIQVNDSTSQIKVIHERPIQAESVPIQIQKGAFITCYGQYQGDYFLANRIEHNEKN
ncbi:hypothetical protein ACJ2A9_09130 [Anaerobacillus sp. MEB173]|uniref:hypothetical protein n=1 Tax=Anaerobacillus sp. MEB173 TaxID=3383345 RepID=UPI003F8E94EC